MGTGDLGFSTPSTLMNNVIQNLKTLKTLLQLQRVALLDTEQKKIPSTLYLVHVPVFCQHYTPFTLSWHCALSYVYTHVPQRHRL